MFKTICLIKWVFLFGMPFFVFSQQSIITGVVTDSLKNVIPYSVVSSSPINDINKTLSYTNTTDSGTFSLKIPASYKQDSLLITIRHISYQKKVLKVSHTSQQLFIKLSKQKNQLNEVIVKAKKALKIKGDTIIYDVNRLKRKKDYTIEEVIDRIPGVKISENGQITYKNKAISHLYINGVDLLEGRYNIATRGIPAAAVEGIEVLQRHNHARIDIGRTESENVAINLKIKEKQGLFFGSSKGDIGTPLITGRGEVTPIFLKQKLQNISSLRVNNIGKSLKAYGSNLVQSNRFISNIQLNDTEIISPPNTNGNNISDKYWLNNTSVGATNDGLYNANDSLLLKASVNFSIDDTALQQEYNSVYYFDNDSTRVNRSTQNNLTEKRLGGGLVQELNKSKFYLKNKLSLTNEALDGSKSIIQNNNSINSLYRKKTQHLKNITHVKNTLGQKVVDSGLILEFSNNNQDLEVNPAVFNEEISPDLSGNKTTQSIETDHFNIGAFTSFDFDIGKTNWDFTQLVNFKNEQLSSDLKVQNTNEQSMPSFPFSGEYNFQYFKTKTQLKSSYKWRRYKLSLTPAFSYISINSEESLSTTIINDNLLFFTPSASLSYRYNNIWNFGLTAARNITTSQFDKLYNGVILRNFTGLSRNAPVVNINYNDRLTFFWGYNDILKGVFFKNSTSFNHSVSDITFSNTIDDDGLLNTIALERPNTSLSWSNRSYLTKRFFEILKTEVSYNFNYLKNEQIFNNTLQKNSNTSHSISLELNLDNGTWYGFNYKGVYNISNSNVNGFETGNHFIKHDLELDFYTSSKTRFNLGTESVISTFSNSSNRDQNTLFNTSFYYKPSKKFFFRASFLNIFNERFFTSSSSSANYISQSKFSLRPRQLTVGFNYTF